jgi:hypothetical protein
MSAPFKIKQVLAFTNFASFPIAANGAEEVMYIDKATNNLYYWKAGVYILLSPILVNGSGTIVNVNKIDLGGLVTVDAVFNLQTFFNFIWNNVQFFGVNNSAAWAFVGNAATMQGIISMFIKTPLFATAGNLATLKLKSTATGEVEYYDAPKIKIGNQTPISNIYTNVSGLSILLPANGIYEVTGNLIWQSTATNNGIGFSFAAMASATCFMSYDVLDRPTTTQTRNSSVAGGHTTSTNSNAANISQYARFNAYIIVGATPATFQLTARSENVSGGNFVRVMSDSSISITTKR